MDDAFEQDPSLMDDLPDPDELYVNCSLNEEQKPIVFWSYAGKQGEMTVTEARNKGQAIFTAAAIGDVESAIFKGLSGYAEPPPPAGFGRKAREQWEKERFQRAKRAAELTVAIRQFRAPLPEGLNVMHGLIRNMPLIVFEKSWYGKQFKFFPDDARGHAMHLIGAAEAAESDGFLYNFLAERLEIELHEVYPMIREFGAFRQRNQLEDLFKKT